MYEPSIGLMYLRDDVVIFILCAKAMCDGVRGPGPHWTNTDATNTVHNPHLRKLKYSKKMRCHASSSSSCEQIPEKRKIRTGVWSLLERIVVFEIAVSKGNNNEGLEKAGAGI